MSFLDKFPTVFGIFWNAEPKKTPNPVKNLSKKLIVQKTNADEEVFEPMNSAVKERLVTSIVVPPIPTMQKKKHV